MAKQRKGFLQGGLGLELPGERTEDANRFGFEGLLEQFGLPRESREELQARRQLRAEQSRQERIDTLVDRAGSVEAPAVQAGAAIGNVIRDNFGVDPQRVSEEEKKEFEIKASIRNRFEELSSTEEFQNLPLEVKSNLFFSIGAQAAFKAGDPGRGTQFLQALEERQRTQISSAKEQQKLDAEVKEKQDLAGFTRRKAEADTELAEARAKAQQRNLDLGGTPVELTKLQTIRDGLLKELERNPDNENAARNLREVQLAIDTETNNVQTIVERTEPTTANLTKLQQEAESLKSLREQLSQVRLDIEGTPEAAGGLGEFRSKIAGSLEQVMRFIGMPNAIVNDVGEVVASDKLLTSRARLRQMEAGLKLWIRRTSRLSPEDRKTAEDLVQDVRTTSGRGQLIALTELGTFLERTATQNRQILLEGLKPLLENTAEEQRPKENEEQDTQTKKLTTLERLQGKQ